VFLDILNAVVDLNWQVLLIGSIIVVGLLALYNRKIARRNPSALIAGIPMVLVVFWVFVYGTAWTILFSFTNSKLLTSTTGCGRTAAGRSRSRTWPSTG
jgi:hypothetical protein